MVEDNLEAVKTFKNTIESFFPELIIQKHFSNVHDAYPYIKNNKFDWLLLDIELENDLTGFDLLNLLGNKRPYKLIFFTGNSTKTIEAIRENAFDYLTKPISIKDLKNTINRYVSTIQNNKIETEIKTTDKNEENEVLKINTHQNTFYIKHKDIIYLKASGAYTNIISTGNKEIKCSKNISTISENLSDEFIRISRSLIINKRHIKMIDKLDDGTSNLNLEEGNTINISNRIRKQMNSEFSANHADTY